MRGGDRWIDELERDRGQAARPRLLAPAGGQRRHAPSVKGAATSRLAGEAGADRAGWLAERLARRARGRALGAGQSAWGRARETRRNLLRAAVIDAGLHAPVHSANDLAREWRGLAPLAFPSRARPCRTIAPIIGPAFSRGSTPIPNCAPSWRPAWTE